MMLRGRCTLILGLLPAALFSLSALAADLITFANGDKRYGNVVGYRRGKVIVELDGEEFAYRPGMILSVEKGMAPRPAAELLRERLVPPPGVAELVQRATGADLDISVRPVGEGRSLTVMVEKGISIPVAMVGVFRSPFYSGVGSYVAGTIRNASGRLVDAGYDHVRIRGYDFLIQVYDAGDTLLGSKRFYLSSFPPGRPSSFYIPFPNVSYDRIAKIRITRRF